MSKRSTSERNARTRARLHARQDGKCYYCKRAIGVLITGRLEPVLEHYIPQHMNGRKVVLACKWCDKKKGMMPGPQFEAIIAEFLYRDGKTWDQTQKDVHCACASVNSHLHKNHPPNLLNKLASIGRYQPSQPVVSQAIEMTTGMACAAS